MILTLGALLVALAQVAGRVTVGFLDEMQPALNRLLARRGVVLHGLSGDWRMLNPIVRVDRIDLPAGYLEGVELEVDAVESVLRGWTLARRLRVTDASIALEKLPGRPWRLRGSGDGEAFDIEPVLRHSDQLELAGTVVLERHGHEPAEVRFDYLGLNRGGVHRHSLALHNRAAQCSGGCRLAVEYHEVEPLWPVRRPETRLTAHSDGFLVPRAVLGLSPLTLARLELGWQQRGDESGGTLELRTEQFDMPGDVSVAMQLDGAVRGADGRHAGSVTHWRVEQGDAVWELPAMAVNADAERIGFWLPHLDLERAARFLRLAFSGVAPAERWLEGLNPKGTARNIRIDFGLQGSGLSYALTLDGLSLDGFKGVPMVRHAAGELLGYERGLQFDLNAQEMTVAFPDVFNDRWQLPYAQGVLQAWFSPNYFGVRGRNLRAEVGGTRAAGGFAMSRPQDREGQRLLLLLRADSVDVAQAQRFVPYRLPQALQDWLLTAPLGGVLKDARLAYQGQFLDEPGELGRRLALAATLTDGRLRYHPDWPEVHGLDGALSVSGSLVEMDVAAGESAGASLAGSRVRVVDNAAAVDLSLDAEADADALLAFVRGTPLADWATFVEPDWAARGRSRVSGEVHVPLNRRDDPEQLAARLRIDLRGVDVDLPGYRIALEGLDGNVRYRYPRVVDASGVSGRLFGEPVTLTAQTRGNRLHFAIDGRARTDDVWRLAAMADPGLASGAFDFQADLGIAMVPELTTELAVTTTLEDTEIRLPGGYGKPAGRAEPTRVQVGFRPDHRSLRFAYRDAVGWLHFADAPLRGAIRFGVDGAAGGEGITSLEAVEPADARDREPALVLGGRVQGFALEEVIPERGDGTGSGAGGPDWLALPIRLQSLAAGTIAIGDFDLTGAMLDGRISHDELFVRVDSTEATGTVEQRGEAPLTVRLSRVRIPVDEPGGDAEPSDPLEPAVIADLPAADVAIDALAIGSEDYGRWRFFMQPEGDDLRIRNLEAEVRGLRIQAPDGLIWHGGTDETEFTGTLTAGNLAQVLPQWDYAPSVETNSARLAGTFRWRGSPLAFDLLALRGEGEARAEQGRFLDVESGAGAQKIFSLMNFTAIAKRISLNFSDVFGRGVSFDELAARFALDEGTLTFLEPMRVEGTGSSFRVGGRVDLETGRLDNDMIVTLPVSKSLPWYAAYVALANPLAGLGVLVGERVLRKPLEQFSSARYHIGGTLDEPEVKLVGVFDVEPTGTVGAAAEPEPGPEPEQ